MKLRAAGRALVRRFTAPINVKTARMLLRVWTANLVMALLVFVTSVMTGAVIGALIGILNLCLNALMVKAAASRYAEAKHLAEKAEWEHRMFEEWSQA